MIEKIINELHSLIHDSEFRRDVYKTTIGFLLTVLLVLIQFGYQQWKRQREKRRRKKELFNYMIDSIKQKLVSVKHQHRMTSEAIIALRDPDYTGHIYKSSAALKQNWMQNTNLIELRNAFFSLSKTDTSHKTFYFNIIEVLSYFFPTYNQSYSETIGLFTESIKESFEILNDEIQKLMLEMNNLKIQFYDVDGNPTGKEPTSFQNRALLIFADWKKNESKRFSHIYNKVVKPLEELSLHEDIRALHETAVMTRVAFQRMEQTKNIFANQLEFNNQHLRRSYLKMLVITEIVTGKRK